VTYLDLKNDFFADPTVEVADDGRSAVLAEDLQFAYVILSNDPGLGDPEVVLPGQSVWLTFDYSFNEATGNSDEFGAFLIDGDNGASIGEIYEFFIDGTGSGTVSWDLSSLAGKTLGLQFELNAYDSEVGSTAIVRDVALQVVPIPAALPLFLGGLGALAGLGAARVRRSRKI